MASSTSPSKPRPIALVALFALVLTMAASVIYTLRINPEIAYFKRVKRAQWDWALQVRSNSAPAIAIAGGSSVGAAIRAKEASAELSRPVLNLGLGAGMGASVIGEAALEAVQSGDTLVLSLEPALLSGDLKPPPLGVQFAWGMGHPEWIAPNRSLPRMAASLLQLRPGARHLMSLLAKMALRRPLYRYGTDFIAADGSVWMRDARSFDGEDSSAFSLSANGAAWLGEFVERCKAKGVRCVYTLPMIYCAPAEITPRREHLERFITQVERHLPVIRTHSLGINTNRSEFSDTPYHPFPKASKAFTLEIVQAAVAMK